MQAYLIGTLLLIMLSSVVGWLRLRRGYIDKWVGLTVGGVSCALLTLWLVERGGMRGACPLVDPGEMLVYLGWALTLFYIVIGGVYRSSLIGLFTAPVVAMSLVGALLPGMLSEAPERVSVVDPWKEGHAAMSVLSYGALGMAALASVMFLILDKRLKQQQAGWLSRKMPPVSRLVTSIYRLVLLGVVMLTVGIGAGVMTHGDSGLDHTIVAVIVWGAYVSLLACYHQRGLTPRTLSRWTLGLFMASCVVFSVI